MTAPHLCGGRGGGLVGRQVVAAGLRAGYAVRVPDIPWTDPGASIEALAVHLRQFAADVTGEWALAWCAGAGVVATSEDDLAQEVDVHDGALRAVEGLIHEGLLDPARGGIFLASSAGECTPGRPIRPSPRRRPSPLSCPMATPRWRWGCRPRARGAHRRASVHRSVGQHLWAGTASGQGPGLISTICVADALGTPLQVRVSLDTTRDYLPLRRRGGHG